MEPDNLETGTSEASDVDLLSEDAEETQSKEVDPEESEEEESLEEPTGEAEDEDSEEEVSEEDESEEEVEEPTRPSWKVIKEKYPELTKDKDFREMFHREKAFSEVFPTVEDAREASEKVGLLESFDTELAQGNVKYLVENLNDETLTKFTDQVLPSLRETNPKLFFRATRPVMVEMLSSVMNRAEATNDENLKKSAQNISKFLFGTHDIPKSGKPVDPEIEQERNRLKTREEQLANQQRSEYFMSAERSIAKQVRRTVEEGLDPKNELTDFVKNSIIEKTLNEVKATLTADPQLTAKIQQIARQAEKNGFPPEFKPRLISAYLGRAKQLALTLRAKHKSAAIGKRTTERKTRIEATSSKADTKQTSTSKPGKKMSDLDIINEGA